MADFLVRGIVASSYFRIISTLACFISLNNGEKNGLECGVF